MRYRRGERRPREDKREIKDGVCQKEEDDR